MSNDNSDALMKKMRRKSQASAKKASTNSNNTNSNNTKPPPRPMLTVLHTMRQTRDPALVYSSAQSQLHHIQDTTGVKEQPLQQYLSHHRPVPLFPIQESGVQFLERRERDEECVGCHSGLLCDEMGLGKTRQILTVILRDNQRRATESGQRFNGTTIILAPGIVLGVWSDEIAKFPRDCFVVQDLRTLTGVAELDQYYYGECDIVLCSYAMLRAAYNHNNLDEIEELEEGEESVSVDVLTRRYKILFGRSYVRCCADEAHQIVVKKTQITHAVSQLQVERMWLITGTPIKNSLGDVHTLLGLAGIKRPLSEEETTELLSKMMLRRTKYDLLLMPTTQPSGLTREAIITTQLVEFDSLVERTLYCVYAGFALRQRRTHAGNTPVLIHYLRQLCLAPALIKGLVVPHGMLVIGQRAPRGDTSLSTYVAGLPQNNTVTYTYKPGVSYNSDDNSCVVAQWSAPSEAMFTQCSDREAVNTMLEEWQQHGTVTQRMSDIPLECEQWRSTFTCMREHTLILDDPSSKECALLRWIAALPVDDKAVVFAMSVGVLNRLHKFLDQPHALIHGKLSEQRNGQERLRFTSDPQCRVLLLSLKKGNAGLNLECANHLGMLDDWWNPVDKQQALSRLMRPGQSKQVHITHFKMRGTVESYVSRVQHNKQDLIERVIPSKKQSSLNEQQEAELFDYTVSIQTEM
jgi:SNF2 family DNA or RNA helicase